MDSSAEKKSKGWKESFEKGWDRWEEKKAKKNIEVYKIMNDYFLRTDSEIV